MRYERLSKSGTLPELKRVPRTIAAFVGKTMILSGQIEYHLLLVSKRLTRTGLKEARVMFANPCWDGYLAKIDLLAHLHKPAIDLGIADLDKLKRKFEKAEQKRNLVAHSAWPRSTHRSSMDSRYLANER